MNKNVFRILLFTIYTDYHFVATQAFKSCEFVGSI